MYLKILCFSKVAKNYTCNPSSQEADELEDSLGYLVTLSQGERGGVGGRMEGEQRKEEKAWKKPPALYSVSLLIKSYVTVFVRIKKPTLFLLTRFQSSDFTSFQHIYFFHLKTN